MTEPAAAPEVGQPCVVGDGARLLELAAAPVFTLYQQVASSPRGLTETEAADRPRRVGDNEPFRVVDGGVGTRSLVALRSPFVALLTGSGAVFAVVGDARGAVTVAVMIVLSVVLRSPSGQEAMPATSAGLALAETRRATSETR